MNKIILDGNLTADPEYTMGEKAARANFSLAHNDRRKEEAMFVDCVAFGDVAERIKNYTHKGTPVQVIGRLDLSTYTREDGTKGRRVSIIVEDWEYFGRSKPASAE